MIEKEICFIDLIKRNIKIDTQINNWSVKGQVRIPYYIFKGIKNKQCLLQQPKTKEIYQISETDLQFMFNKWEDYKKEKIVRHELRDENWTTTYTICLMHYLEELNLL